MSEAENQARDASMGGVVWLTGLSGAGKSTLANALVPVLKQQGKRHVEILDGDVVRTHLSKGLGFSREDRDENVLRIAFVAHLLARNGVIVLVAAVSPYKETRQKARDLIGDASFVEVHVAAPLEACAARDVKGLYKKALAGEIPAFTGVSDPYEPPDPTDSRVVVLDTSALSVENALRDLTRAIEDRGWIRRPT